MLKKLLLILLLAILVLGVFWIGLSIYGNLSCSNDKPVELPDEAKHRVIFEATGEVLFIDTPERIAAGYTIAHGYWELVDGEYEYRDIDLPLDEEVSGNIRIEAIK